MKSFSFFKHYLFVFSLMLSFSVFPASAYHPGSTNLGVVRAVEREDVQGLGLVFTAESVSRVGVVSLSRRKGSAERRNRSPGVATVVTRDAKR